MPFQQYPTETYPWVERPDLVGLQMVRNVTEVESATKQAIACLFKDLMALGDDWRQSKEEEFLNDEMEKLINEVKATLPPRSDIKDS